jgi:hypothetical protein
VPDIHIVSLDARLEGLIVPSKFVGVIALGKPVLWLGDVNGEMALLVSESGCGVALAAGDAAGVGAKLRSLDAERLARMGEAASSLWHSRFRRERALQEWRSLLAET